MEIVNTIKIFFTEHPMKFAIHLQFSDVILMIKEQ